MVRFLSDEVIEYSHVMDDETEYIIKKNKNSFIFVVYNIMFVILFIHRYIYIDLIYLKNINL